MFYLNVTLISTTNYVLYTQYKWFFHFSWSLLWTCEVEMRYLHIKKLVYMQRLWNNARYAKPQTAALHHNTNVDP